jgi:hypothetical protein
MNHYMDFDPHLIRERNEQMRREVNLLRLEERPRDNDGSSRSWFFILARRSALPLLRGAGLLR